MQHKHFILIYSLCASITFSCAKYKKQNKLIYVCVYVYLLLYTCVCTVGYFETNISVAVCKRPTKYECMCAEQMEYIGFEYFSTIQTTKQMCIKG